MLLLVKGCLFANQQSKMEGWLRLPGDFCGRVGEGTVEGDREGGKGLETISNIEN